MTTAYPVRVQARLQPDLSRWLWLVKWFLAIPHYVLLAFLWIAYSVVGVIAFFAILFTGRYPRPLFDFSVGVLRWTWRVAYYSFGALATDRYPPFSLGEERDYPATLDIAYPERLSRGLVLVKWWLLAIPHYLIVGIFLGGGWYAASRADDWAFTPAGGLVGLCVLVAGVVLLFTGRYPRGVFDFVLGMDRWALRVAAYVGLMTDAYPPFRLDTGGDEPGVTTIGSPPPPVEHPHDTGWSGGRIAGVVIGALLLAVGAGVSAGGAIVLWADQAERDAAGYLVTPTQALSSDGYALEFGTMDLHWSEAGFSVGDDWLGDVFVRTEPEAFVGIGPTDDVTRYLSGVDHHKVLGVGGDLAYEHTTGSAPASPPTAQDFWAASGNGSLTWRAQEGSWTAVVMNPDGSRVVDTTVTAGATLPVLRPIAWGLLAAGIVLLLIGGVLVLLFAIRPTRPAAEPQRP